MIMTRRRLRRASETIRTSSHPSGARAAGQVRRSRQSISLYPCWPATVLAANPSAPESLLARSRLRPPASGAIALLSVPLSLRRRLRPCDTVGRLRRRTGTAATTRARAMVGGLAHSDRVIFAAGAVMVAVFLNVGAVRAVAAEADGDDLRHAVLLDALLVG
jgi:hypothetical protein